ncbi:hypothetical protein GGI07_005270 [Coemansia sp. Benny D115]|nr:hypothetical protein GGI07_005270 [Coemansia sp. Benny D115]
MADLASKFDAMMANVTAPPLSLEEFRLFVENDEKARHALAFCEWYQRYRTVYFDRIALASTRYTAATSGRPTIPSAFSSLDASPTQQTGYMNAEHVSLGSVSTPNIRMAGASGTVMRNMFTLKSHSFSNLSESMVDSAFNTSASDSSGSGSGKAKRPNAIPSVFQQPVYQPSHRKCAEYAQDTTGYYEDAHFKTITNSKKRLRVASGSTTGHTVSRRRTLPMAAGEVEMDQEVLSQEFNRTQLQSLLIYECWARFLCDEALERVEMPDSEQLYIKERLPLGITCIPRPLLCFSDMLDSPEQSAKDPVAVPKRSYAKNGHVKALSRGTRFNSKPGATALQLVSHRSLQFQPYEQLKRSLMSQVNIRRLNVAHAQSPFSFSFGVRDTADSGMAGNTDRPIDDESDYTNSVSAKEFIANLRRISTMPTLKMSKDAGNSSKLGLFGTVGQSGIQTQPRPARATRLLSLGLLQTAHPSIRPRPPLKYIVGDRPAGEDTPVYGYKPLPKTLSNLIVPSAVPPALFDTIARLSADYLLNYHFASFYKQARYNITARGQRACVAGSVAMITLGLADLQTDTLVPPDMAAIQTITGTLRSSPLSGFAGYIYTTGRCGCERNVGLADSTSQFVGSTTAHSSSHLGNVSDFSLWSHITANSALGGLLDKLVCFMLRKRCIGQQWFVDLRSRRYEVLEPSILGEQCQIICFQLLVSGVFGAGLMAALFLIP